MNNSLEIENKLVEEAKQDSEKFAVLYDKYFNQIYRYIARRVADQEMVQDLVSQTFFDALNNLGKYTFRGFPFSSWLYKIAHNNVLKWYKDNSKFNKVDLEEITELKSEENVLEEVSILEDRKGIRAKLDELEVEERELIRLKYFEEVSNIEIGEIMGITPNNVGVKLYRALKRLKQIMD